mmetsp:Transcript_20152/g.29921  ORF Transcript_20152/g.29921 Transcript_20152/m.29921 type:complete len:264 (-) Transcript_20152:256-1047(-)|eukprot:CAMPEP_0194227854 /NCGR_PEP_ID=MMETSP0156-20130528/43070_1 /TAXON_ID=33649 /ORGANISM="Thalassionema nitzschioides, Strain L26-B" /LENGTH=263 /DNA_ID=CAMNT_0038960349 /DNA_START=36 /DNA_END=827 /DNA_ORIENTATION=+
MRAVGHLAYYYYLLTLSGRVVAGANSSNISSAFITSRGEVLRKIVDTAGGYAAFSSSTTNNMIIDQDYPGTAVERMLAIRERVAGLEEGWANRPWDEVRRRILWAGGLRDLPDAVPGKGYTGHSFNDYNHVDLTAMRDTDNENDGSVKGIAIGNFLGDGIRVASLPELGPGGSWSTCAIGCNKEPPQDVAHIQFQARIAFKLVWVPTERFDSFVLVDDAGKFLNKGAPAGGLPPLRERMTNYRIVANSKYAIEAEKLAAEKTS